MLEFLAGIMLCSIVVRHAFLDSIRFYISLGFLSNILNCFRYLWYLLMECRCPVFILCQIELHFGDVVEC